jgi:hypothetical protein
VNRGREAGHDPVLITQAAPSLLAQHEARKRRYIITMAVRVLCLILATVFYQTLWVMGVFAILAIILPWIAVMVANDRPPKKTLNTHLFRGNADAMPVTASSPKPAIEPVRIIDADD